MIYMIYTFYIYRFEFNDSSRFGLSELVLWPGNLDHALRFPLEVCTFKERDHEIGSEMRCMSWLLGKCLQRGHRVLL
jgi:hypothetical protein